MKAKILVVDDEEHLRDLLKDTLEMEGFEPFFAFDEDSFREALKQEKPDAIILDIMLGSQNGAEIYEKLLREGLDRRIPVVFLTALAQDRPPTHLSPEKRYALLGKPFDLDSLVHELRSALAA